MKDKFLNLNFTEVINDKYSYIGLLILIFMITFINLIQLFALIGYQGRVLFILSIFIGAFLFFLNLISVRNYNNIKKELDIFIGLNFAFFILVLLNGILFNNKTRLIYGIYQYIIYYLIFFSVYQLMNNKYILSIFKFILGFNFVLSIVLVGEFITRKNIINPDNFGSMAYQGITVARARAFYGSFLNAGVVLCIAALIDIYFIYTSIRNKRKYKSILYIIYFIGYILGIFATGSRGPLVSLAISGLIFLILYNFMVSSSKKLTAKGLFVIIALSVAIIVILLNIDPTKINNKMLSFIVNRIKSIFNWKTDPGNVGRKQSWIFAINLIKSHFIMGIGVAATGAKGVGSFSIGVTESGFLKKFSEMGIVGLVLSYGIFIYVIKSGLSFVKNKNNNLKILLLLLICAFISVLIEDFIYQGTEAEVVSFYLWFVGASIFKIGSMTNSNEINTDSI